MKMKKIYRVFLTDDKNNKTFKQKINIEHYFENHTFASLKYTIFLRKKKNIYIHDRKTCF